MVAGIAVHRRARTMLCFVGVCQQYAFVPSATPKARSLLLSAWQPVCRAPLHASCSLFLIPSCPKIFCVFAHDIRLARQEMVPKNMKNLGITAVRDTTASSSRYHRVPMAAAAMASELRAPMCLFSEGAEQPSDAAGDATAAGGAVSHCCTAIGLLVVNKEAPSWTGPEGMQLRARLCSASLALGLACAAR